MSRINQIWFDVYSEMYGTTKACVIDIANTLKIGKCDCSDGEAYTLTRHEIQQLEKGLEKEDDFTPSNKLDYPKNIIALLRPSEKRMDIPQNFKLSKKEYTDLKKEILKAGGKYRKNGFDFDESANDVYDRIITGKDYNLKKKFQFFATPESLAAELCEMTFDPLLNKGVNILEPSAGQGAIIDSILEWFNNKAINISMNSLTAIELMDKNYNHLENNYNTDEAGMNLLKMDFLKYDEYINYFDYVIANPPFTGGQDIEHFNKMYEVCKPGGVITSIMSTSWLYNSGKKFQNFRNWIGIGNDKSLIEEIRRKELSKGHGDCSVTRVSESGNDEQVKINTYPAGTFKESGTNVITCVVQIIKKRS